MGGGGAQVSKTCKVRFRHLVCTETSGISMTAADNQRQYEARLLRVLAYIHDNLDGDLSLDRLADVACMSRFHWHRVFRAMTGETLADAVRRIRLSRAANALVSEERPIEEIAAPYRGDSGHLTLHSGDIGDSMSAEAQREGGFIPETSSVQQQGHDIQSNSPQMTNGTDPINTAVRTLCRATQLRCFTGAWAVGAPTVCLTASRMLDSLNGLNAAVVV